MKLLVVMISALATNKTLKQIIAVYIKYVQLLSLFDRMVFC
jgi:hypothetical protein